MNRRQFSTLLILAVVATLAVLLLAPGESARVPVGDDARLLPVPAEWVNSVSEVVVRQGQDRVTLRRGEGHWLVEELHGYPADWSRLRDLLADLSAARVMERKTDNPAYYDRLGVEDPESEGASGVLLRLQAGDDTYALIVGNAASRGGGQYVRPSGEAGSVLIDKELDVPRGAVEWAQTEIVDVASSDAAEVEIIHPDGDWVLAEKQNPADTDFSLASLPEGRDITSSWSVNSLGGALSDLRMEDVLPAVAVDDSSTTRFRLLTFSGIEYTVDAWSEGDDRWIQLSAARVAGDAETSGEPPATVEALAKEETSMAEVAAINQQVAGWRFRVPQYKFEALTKRSEALLQPLEDAAAAVSD